MTQTTRKAEAKQQLRENILGTPIDKHTDGSPMYLEDVFPNVTESDFSDRIAHLIDEYVKALIPEKPFSADKTQQPILKEESGPMGGGMPGTANWHLDTGHTASEQDAEDARFECAKPYLDEICRRAGIGGES